MKHDRAMGQMNTEARSFGSQRKFSIFGSVVDKTVRESADSLERRPMHDEGARCEGFPGERALRLFAPEISKVSGNIEEMGCKGQARCRWMDDVCHGDRIVVPGCIREEMTERMFRKLNVRVKKQYPVRCGQSHASVAARSLVSARHKTVSEVKWPFLILEPKSVPTSLVLYDDNLNPCAIDRLPCN
jgi:hypothetical protein